MSRTITAVYDNKPDAELAKEQLVAAGISSGDITIHDQASATASKAPAKDFITEIKEFFGGHEDSHAYAEAVKRGHYLLTAKVEDARSDAAYRILESSRAVDFDRRQADWRAAGWDGKARSGDEKVIPIVEERLKVGKREVERGGVKVRSYIVETPVHEDVSLREERVSIERRPGAGPPAAGEDAFRERNIELTETAEEAVVAKEAVVREELVVRKDVSERDTDIDETVRRTEVKVEDTRGEGVREREDRSFVADRDPAKHSLAMDPDGDRIEETELERKERLANSPPRP